MSGMGLILFVIVVMIVFFALRAKRSRQRDEVEGDEQIKRGLEAGDLARHHITNEVFIKCVICGEPATELPPKTGKSWMDRIPQLKQLFSLPPRYIIEDNEHGQFKYCPIHKELAVTKLEEAHALLRAQRAQFITGQANRVAHMDSKGIELALREEFQNMSAALKEQEEALKVPQLPEAEESPAPQRQQRALSIVTSSLSDDDTEDSGPQGPKEAMGDGP
jgi:hypothetical protein